MNGVQMGSGSRQVIGHSVLPGADGDKTPAGIQAPPGAPCEEDWSPCLPGPVCAQVGGTHIGVLTPGDGHPLTAGTPVATGPSLPSRGCLHSGGLGRDPSPIWCGSSSSERLLAHTGQHSRCLIKGIFFCELNHTTQTPNCPGTSHTGSCFLNAGGPG